MDPIIVTLPDGQEVEFPAGTPREVMLDAMRRHVAKQQATAPAAPAQPAGPAPAPTIGEPPSQGERYNSAGMVMGRGDRMLADVGEGIQTGINWLGTRGTNAAAAIIGTPRAYADATQAGADYVASKVTGRPVVNAPNPLSPLTPIINRFAPGYRDVATPSADDIKGKVYGDFGVPQVNLPGTAGKVIDTGVEAALSAVATPGSLPRTVGPAFVGGASSEVAGEATKGTKWEPVARIGAGLVGAGATAALQEAGRRVVSAGVEAARPFSESGRQTVAGTTLNRAATDRDRAVANLAADREAIPGSRGLTAQVANDPGLLSMQNALSGGPGRGGEPAVRLAQNNAARAAALEGIQPTGDPASARAFFANQIAQRRAALDAEVTGVRTQAQNAERAALSALEKELDNLPPGMTAADAGRVIQDAANRRVDVLTALRSRTAEPFYTAARENTGVFPATGAIASLNQELATAADTTRAGVERAIRAFARDDGSPRTSIAELDGTFKALGVMQTEAKRNGDANLARILGNARASLETTMRQEPMYDVGKGVYERLSRPLDPYQNPRIAPIVARDTMDRARPTMAPDTIPGRLFKPGADGGAAIRDYIATRPGDEALGALRNDIGRQAREVFDKSGAKGLDTFLRDRKPALDALDSVSPGFSDSMRNVVGARQRLDVTQATGKDTVTQAERNALARAREIEATPVNAFAGTDSGRGIGAVLAADDARQRMATLVAEAKKDTTGRALDGLRREVVDDARRAMRTVGTDALGEPQLSNAGMQRWWAKNRAAVSDVMTPDQVKTFDALAGDFARDARTAPRMAGSDTDRNIRSGTIITGTIMEEILGKRAGAWVGNAGLSRPIKWLFSAPEAQVREVLADAALDPAFARFLMMKASDANRTAIGRALRQPSGMNAFLSPSVAVGVNAMSRGAPAP